ncbi:hypothetical protein [Aneurinibacillus migulanus]|uniref:Uncharacterized protein n=1 Tax=Aneurinibacillus migulanus TaxID=47500 RepID=A0A0D1USZ5_ANEMI|nr:hypothetical protein [Aneurinibacillus migulanus]KIV50054.1 hypothetical protein TS65_29795 [Aneurinibacillus migulanus]KON95215.1 hypothetical protein AF333_06725 [Aneurinibacillus migulanus]MED0895710.1 hypothetical protein [Aneurinibacillus migulanus]MED1619771.1 hypothetical protein [Aneurinibacillus migulanus]SDK32387.1 hypothetical protein SAMN04487909_1493 [Aneurinibacillus migulanus]
MKKVIYALLGATLVTGISTSAFAEEANKNLQELTPVVKPMATFYDREPNNTEATANPFILGHEIEGTLDDGDYHDYYKFVPSENVTYTLQLSARGGTDIRMFVSGNEWSFTGWPGEELTLQFKKGQTYYIDVYKNSTDEAIDYSVFTY